MVIFVWVFRVEGGFRSGVACKILALQATGCCFEDDGCLLQGFALSRPPETLVSNLRLRLTAVAGCCVCALIMLQAPLDQGRLACSSQWSNAAGELSGSSGRNLCNLL